jgi:hypothetical protein
MLQTALHLSHGLHYEIQVLIYFILIDFIFYIIFQFHRAGSMSYEALGGLMRVENVTFAHFKQQCGARDYAVSSNSGNSDGQHPIEMSNAFLRDVDVFSKVWIHRPDITLINPARCVDMDCDGLKKNLFTDLDGSFLGLPGSVFSQSEFGWNAPGGTVNAARGLGDYRIPKELLAAANGSLLPIRQVYKLPGIVRDETLCSYMDNWQAYACNGLDYKVLLIESMDADTEKRRISPVAILSDNGYLDLMNGPGGMPHF